MHRSNILALGECEERRHTTDRQIENEVTGDQGKKQGLGDRMRRGMQSLREVWEGFSDDDRATAGRGQCKGPEVARPGWRMRRELGTRSYWAAG